MMSDTPQLAEESFVFFPLKHPSTPRTDHDLGHLEILFGLYGKIVRKT